MKYQQECGKGGAWYNDVFDYGKRMASNPLVQKLVTLAKPGVEQYAKKKAPGFSKNVEGLTKAYESPMGQLVAELAKEELGMGRRRRGRGMTAARKADCGKCEYCGGSMWDSMTSGLRKAVSMGQNIANDPMAQALFKIAKPGLEAYAQKKAPKFAKSVQSATRAYESPLGQIAAAIAKDQLGLGKPRRSRPATAHSLAVGKVMRETGMGLPAASRYVKEQQLACCM